MLTSIKDNRLEIKIAEDITVSWVRDRLEQMRRAIDKDSFYEEIVLDMEKVEEAHRMYQNSAPEQRNDAVAMQFLRPGWAFDPKRPCLATAVDSQSGKVVH